VEKGHARIGRYPARGYGYWSSRWCPAAWMGPIKGLTDPIKAAFELSCRLLIA